MQTVVDVASAVESDGFAIVEGILDDPAIDGLLRAIEALESLGSVRTRGGVFAIRNLLSASPEVAALAHSVAIRSLVALTLGESASPVRGILFDKIPGANWKVPWHQDVTIAVQHRVEVAGFGPWSTKADVLHVQPPAAVLERMLSVRVHLDDCQEENGALRVLPGSHKQGRFPEGNITSRNSASAETVCAVRRGGALLMRPLLLHASSPAQVPHHRRVVHLDYAAVELPGGLRWLDQPPLS